MAQSRDLSIFLLKDGEDRSSALENGHKLIEARATNLSEGSTLYVLCGQARPPWWRGYFGVEAELWQQASAALVFLPVEGRVFVVALGYAYHSLRSESYEYDFGIKVTLNCVDPNKVKSADVVEPGAARSRRIQNAFAADLTYFDFDRDSSVLKSLTGKVKNDYIDVLKQATGMASLRVSTLLQACELVNLCRRLLPLYFSDEYLTTFPDIRKVTPVRDPQRVAALNRNLQGQIRERSDRVHMCFPKIIDYGRDGDGLCSVFSGVGSSLVYPDVLIECYYDYLDRRGCSTSSLTVDQLKKHRVGLCCEDGIPWDIASVYNSILFDTMLSGSDSAFYLNDGKWYEVDPDYVRRLESDLNPFWVPLSYMQPFVHGSEAEYNEHMGKEPGFVCLDRTNVSPNGQAQIEPSDLCTIDDDHAVLVHVKIGTSSSQLSHLFNQGTNAVELLKLEDAAPGRLVKRIEVRRQEGQDVETLTTRVLERKYKVVFGIISKKPAAAGALNLPLFSRISLARNAKFLSRVMGVPVEFGFIRDESNREAVKKKAGKRGSGDTAA